MRPVTGIGNREHRRRRDQSRTACRANREARNRRGVAIDHVEIASNRIRHQADRVAQTGWRLPYDLELARLDHQRRDRIAPPVPRIYEEVWADGLQHDRERSRRRDAYTIFPRVVELAV